MFFVTFFGLEFSMVFFVLLFLFSLKFHLLLYNQQDILFFFVCHSCEKLEFNFERMCFFFIFEISMHKRACRENGLNRICFVLFVYSSIDCVNQVTHNHQMPSRFQFYRN